MIMLRELLYKLKWLGHHPDAFAKFVEIMSNEHRSVDELMAMQEVARRKIVTAAMENTAFYPKFYATAGFERGDTGSESWFEKLPIVAKKDLREHFDEFIDPKQKQFLNISTTGGSTGTPTKTGYDARICEEVYSWRLQARYDVHPWDDHAYVWRDTRKSKTAKLKNALAWWPTRHLKMDATFIMPEAIVEFLRTFNRLKPALLQGYVGAITQVAQYVLDKEMKVWSPNVVWTTSAPLPLAQRKLIETAFGAPVCDEYGSCECRWIASQCPEGKGLHVNVEHVHIEFVDDANKPVPKGEYGRTLVTNLEDTVFPLIRYENGDRGRWLTESCSCGRTLPCIDSVKGRESESFVLPSGKSINGEYLTTIFDETPDIVQGFRVVQHKDLSITIEYIPAGDESEITKILNGFAMRLGGEVPVDFKRVESIPHDRGKLRFVVREK
jgi:phenylacetate-CoA ligase